MMGGILMDFCNDLEKSGKLFRSVLVCYTFSHSNLHDRFIYIDNIVKTESKKFDVNGGEKIDVKKNDKDSLSYRKNGNSSYKAQRYLEALSFYNKSVSFAASDEYIATAYSNRSAVLFEMGKFQDCLENIRLAKSFEDLPQGIRIKLIEREQRCQNFLQPQLPGGGTPIPNLSYREHHHVPFVVDCLDVKRKGRNSWVYTKKALQPGDIIAKPKLFLCQISNGWSGTCCYCMKPEVYTLIPCPNCTRAMFCSQNCMEQANKQFHKWECPIIDHLNYLVEDEPAIEMAFRLLLNLLNILPDIEELDNFFAHLNEHLSYFSLTRSTFDSKQHYRVLCSAFSKLKFDHHELFFYGIIASLLKKEVMKHSGLKDLFVTEDQKILFGEIIYRHVLICSRNFTTVGFNAAQGPNWLAHWISVLDYEIKTSKNPNVDYAWPNNSQVVLKVQRPIAENSLLLLPDINKNSSATRVMSQLLQYGNLTVRMAIIEHRSY